MKKNNRLYNLKILQTDIWEKNSVKKEKMKNTRATWKWSSGTFVSSKEKTPKELPMLKRNKIRNAQDRTNIMKMIIFSVKVFYAIFAYRWGSFLIQNNPLCRFDPDEPFKWNLIRLARGHVRSIFIIYIYIYIYVYIACVCGGA